MCVIVLPWKYVHLEFQVWLFLLGLSRAVERFIKNEEKMPLKIGFFIFVELWFRNLRLDSSTAGLQ